MKNQLYAIIAFFILLLPAPAVAQENLRLGVMPSMDYLPLAVAQREGYFKEQGVDVALHRFFSANERDAAFHGGALDGTVIDYTGAVLQKSGGVKLKLTSACDAPFYLMASPKSGVRALNGLKGKKIAVSRHTVIDYLVDMALNQGGLKPSAVQKVEINKIPLRFEMLLSGQVDVTGLPDPLASIARIKGAALLASNKDLGFTITGIMFSEKATQSKPEAIRKMYRAYNQGVAYLKAHPVADVADILVKEMNFTEELAQKATLPAYTPARPPKEADIASVIGWFEAKDLLEEPVTTQAIIDASFLDLSGPRADAVARPGNSPADAPAGSTASGGRAGKPALHISGDFTTGVSVNK